MFRNSTSTDYRINTRYFASLKPLNQFFFIYFSLPDHIIRQKPELPISATFPLPATVLSVYCGLHDISMLVRTVRDDILRSHGNDYKVKCLL